jgi:hypothetical protein
MQIDVQLKFKNDPQMAKFLSENSHWYKYLNRNPLSYKNFVEDMKNRYKIRTTDKINNEIDNIELIGNVLDIFK